MEIKHIKIELDEKTHQALKIRAAQEKTPIRGLVLQIILDYLKGRKVAVKVKNQA